MRRAISTALVALVATGAAIATVAADASAMGAPIQITQNVNMRSGPGSSFSRVGGIYTGQSPDFICWSVGENINGVNVWFDVNANGATGYYASYYDNSSYASDALITSKYGIPQCGTQSATQTPTVNPQPPTVNPQGSTVNPQGSTVNPQAPTSASSTGPASTPAPSVDQTAANVVRWASAHSGAVFATTAEHRLLARVGADWGSRGDGPYGEWAGDCYRFAFLAWYANGVRPSQAPTAQAAESAYHRAGRVHGGVPPAGAMVFYAYGSLGHVGISLGNGQVMSTHGLDYSYKPISARPYNAMGLPYLGWVDPRS
jgi:uncharacterized protein YraI